jgi:hypothetical protein
MLFSLAAGLAERAADLARRKFAHRALRAAAIFLFAEALMVRLVLGARSEFVGAPRILRSSLFKESSCSFMAAARLSWLAVRSCMFMREVNSRVRWRKQDLARCFPPLSMMLSIQGICLTEHSFDLTSHRGGATLTVTTCRTAEGRLLARKDVEALARGVRRTRSSRG